MVRIEKRDGRFSSITEHGMKQTMRGFTTWANRGTVLSFGISSCPSLLLSRSISVVLILVVLVSFSKKMTQLCPGKKYGICQETSFVFVLIFFDKDCWGSVHNRNKFPNSTPVIESSVEFKNERIRSTKEDASGSSLWQISCL